MRLPGWDNPWRTFSCGVNTRHTILIETAKVQYAKFDNVCFLERDKILLVLLEIFQLIVTGMVESIVPRNDLRYCHLVDPVIPLSVRSYHQFAWLAEDYELLG